jgi:hypothetical protein
MADEILRVITKLFTHTNRLTHSLDTAESQIKGLLILKDRQLILAALRDLVTSLRKIELEAAGAVSEVGDVLRQLDESRIDAA